MEGLGILYSRYMDLVYGVCLKYLREPEDAKDAVLAIFEELTVKLRKYEVSYFKGWLYQLSKNYCLMRLRSKKGKPVNIDVSLVHLADDWHPDGTEDKEAAFGSMEYCLGELQPPQRIAVELFYLKEKCYKEIASETKSDIGQVRSFIQNGRRKLKICMEKHFAKTGK